MFSQILYVAGVVLTLAVGAAMFLRYRGPSSLVVAIGAAVNGSGHVLQALSPALEVNESPTGEAIPPYVDFGLLWSLGGILSISGWVVFLLGLLWYFVSLRSSRSRDGAS
jgi:hypothetical protein